MSIALLVVACLSLVFGLSFLMAAIFVLANSDQRPFDRDADRMLSSAAWLGFAWFIYSFAIVRQWRQCQLGRRLFCVGLACGVLAVLCGYLAARGG